MIESYAYPPAVALTLQQQWPAHGLPLPALPLLTGFIAGGYQASLLREEDRPVQCSLFLLPGVRPPGVLRRGHFTVPQLTAARSQYTQLVDVCRL